MTEGASALGRGWSIPGMARRLAPCPAARRMAAAFALALPVGWATIRPMYAGGMDLDLAPEHGLLRDTVRQFMLAEVAPQIDEHERERRFPVDVVRRLGEMGWLGIPIPGDEGGAGLDTLAYAIAVDEIGRVWGSLFDRRRPHQPSAAGRSTWSGRPSRRPASWVPLASGQVIGAYGLTESGAGSMPAGRARRPAREGSDGAPGGSTGQAVHHLRRPGGTYRDCLDGHDRQMRGRRSRSSPATRPASAWRLEDKMGLHGSSTGELVFEASGRRDAHVLGAQGTGFRRSP